MTPSRFVQALKIGGRKGQPSRLDGVRENMEDVLKANIHGLEEVVIHLDGWRHAMSGGYVPISIYWGATTWCAS